MRALIVFDCETSGLDPYVGQELIQIAALSLNGHDYTEHEGGKFTVLLKPKNPEMASPEALQVIGPLWEKSMKEGLEQTVGLKKFIRFINSLNASGKYYDKPILVGFNNHQFDEPFLKYWLVKYNLVKHRKGKGFNWPWAHYSKDVFHQMDDLFGRDNLKNKRLDTYLQLLGLSRSAATHEAMEDVCLTAEIFRRYGKLMDRIRQNLRIENPVEAQ